MLSHAVVLPHHLVTPLIVSRKTLHQSLACISGPEIIQKRMQGAVYSFCHSHGSVKSARYFCGMVPNMTNRTLASVEGVLQMPGNHLTYHNIARAGPATCIAVLTPPAIAEPA